MSDQLEKDLAELKEHLAALDVNDSKAKAEMDLLISDIELQLATPTANSSDTLVEQIEGSISEFETSHPTLTGVLNNILVTLSNMGV